MCAAGISGALVVAFSGFFALQQNPSQQLDVIGDVQFTVSACISGRNTCDDGNSHENDTVPNSMDGLVAFRVPESSTVKSAAVAEGAAGTPARTVTPDPAYSAELERLIGTGTDEKWVGFRTKSADTTAGSSLTYTIRFSLPESQIEGDPSGGTFAYRVVTGATEGTPDAGTPAALDCGSNPAMLRAGSRTICVDTPAAGQLGANNAIDVRDLAIGRHDSGVQQVTPGQHATLDFDAVFEGASTPDASFDFDASTDLPGAAAIPPGDGFTPATYSTTPKSVDLAVPAGTEEGRYYVTLTASLANGQTRSATKTIEVPDTTAPQTKITSGPKRNSTATKAKFKFSADEPAGFTCKLDGLTKVTCKSPMNYRHLRPGKHKFKVYATDLSGNKDRTPAAKKFTVKKKHR